MTDVTLLHPKKPYQFAVKFAADGIEQTVLSFNLLTGGNLNDNSAGVFGITATFNVDFKFEDDTEDQVYDALQNLKNAATRSIVVEYMDGNTDTVLRKLELVDPTIDNIAFDKLDYSNAKGALTITTTVSYLGTRKIK